KISMCRKGTTLSFLVPEMALACEDHGDGVTIGHANSLLVAYRASGLDDGSDACFGGYFNTVCKGEIGVRCEHRTTRPLSSFIYCQLHTGSPVHLSRTNADNCQFVCQDNGIGFDMAHNLPGKHKVGYFFQRWLTFCDY